MRARSKLEVPTDTEIRIIEQSAGKGWLKAAIVMMSQAGLREGALPTLSISADRFSCTTKGKEQRGRLPQEARKAIQAAGLSLRSPFSGMKAHKIADAFKYLTKKLHAEGKIRAKYSCHDLRHAFAARFYQATHDVYATKTALGHASVAVTEGYLRSLGLER